MSVVWYEEGVGTFRADLLAKMLRPTRIFFILGIFLMTPLASFAASIPPVGSVAPIFTLLAQDGKPVSLNLYRGKWVVLYFYPRDFSRGCTLEAHGFERDQMQYEAKNAVVLGISLDSTESHQKFCTKEGLRYKLLSDGDHKVASLYGSYMNLAVFKFASRHTFLINPDGKVARVFIDVTPDRHSEEVLAVLTQLQQEAGSSR